MLFDLRSRFWLRDVLRERELASGPSRREGLASLLEMLGAILRIEVFSDS
jgi:hypothetical protein